MHRKAACRGEAHTARQRQSWDEAFAQVSGFPQSSFLPDLPDLFPLPVLPHYSPSAGLLSLQS